MIDYKKAFEQYKETKLTIPTKRYIENMLKRKFKAVELPLYSIDKEDYKNDDEVNERAIYKLFTITSPEILPNLFIEEERQEFEENKINAKKLQEEYPYDVNEEDLIYNTLLEEHSFGYRLSVVLEGKKDIVTSFKLYGVSNYLNSYLVAKIGLSLKEKNFRNLDDYTVQYYLECLVRHGVVKL